MNTVSRVCIVDGVTMPAHSDSSSVLPLEWSECQREGTKKTVSLEEEAHLRESGLFPVVDYLVN